MHSSHMYYTILVCVANAPINGMPHPPPPHLGYVWGRGGAFVVDFEPHGLGTVGRLFVKISTSSGGQGLINYY